MTHAVESDPPNVALRPIDHLNWRACIALELLPDQLALVCPNVESIAEVGVVDGAEALGVYTSEGMAGLAVLFHTEREVELHRFMIDRRYQGKGVGKAALRALLDMAAARAEVRTMRVKFLHWNTVAEHAYRSVGFVDSGENDGDEKVFTIDVTTQTGTSAHP